MIAFFSFAGKLQLLMHSFKMKVKCGRRICVPSIVVPAGTLHGPVGSVGIESLMISKQSFSDTSQNQKRALAAVKIGASINLPKFYPRFEKKT